MLCQSELVGRCTNSERLFRSHEIRELGVSYSTVCSRLCECNEHNPP